MSINLKFIRKKSKFVKGMIFKMDKLIELKQERAALIKKQRKILDEAEKENRAMSGQEETKWERIDEDIDTLENRINKLQKTIDREKEIAGQESKKEPKNVEYKDAFDKFLRRGRNSLTRAEVRALTAGTDSEGGHLVPTEFESRLLQALEERNVMRRIATVNSTSAESKIPVASDTGAATWVDESGAYQEDDPSFDQKTIDAYKAGTIIKVSEELLYDNDYNLEGYISNRFVRRIGDLEETAYVDGDGSGKPKGFLQDAETGVTAAAQDAVTTDEIFDLYHSAKEPYRRNARFLFNDDTAKALRKLKDGQGNYLWQPGLQAGQPDVLLGKPVDISTDMPDLSTGKKAIAFGDFSFFEIYDRQGIFMQRLNELYAANGQIGFRAYKRSDSLLMLPEAIKVVLMA